jgi:hypothetical protein
MFDITDLISVQSNPLVAKSFIKYMTFSDLNQAVKIAKEKGNLILNNKDIIEAIIETDDDSKILLLALGSKLNDEFSNRETFIKIYNRGLEFQSALLGNSDYDWYSLFIWMPEFQDIVLADVLEKDSNLMKPFYTNPRMDRQLIASIIRGKKQKYSNINYDFSNISFSDRYEASFRSLNVNEIKSIDYVGKSSPEDNELYFDKPYEAVLCFIRDLIENWNIQEKYSYYYSTNLIYYIDRVDLDIDYYDWTNDEEINEIKDLSTELELDEWDVKHRLALSNLIDFFDRYSKDIKITNKKEDNEKEFEKYTIVSLAILIIPNLLKRYIFNKEITINFFLDKLIKSDNWVMRSVAYSYMFRNIKFDKEDIPLLSNLIETFREDKLSLVWGIFNTTKYMISKKIRPNLRDELDELFDSCSFNEDMIEYLCDSLSYYFGVDYRNSYYEDLEEVLTKDSWNCSEEIIEKYIENIKDKLNNSNNKNSIENNLNANQNLSFNLGKTVSKFFK